MALTSKFMCAAVCLVVASVQAAPATMTADQRVNGWWALEGDSGVWQFSTMLISALNTVKPSLAEVSPADLQVTTSSTPSGGGAATTRFTGVRASAPITALAGDFDAQTDSFNLQQVSTQGGATLTTISNGTTDGPGFLSIRNLKVDFLSKRVFADISGGNGVGDIQGYHLWTYTTLTGSTALKLPQLPGAGQVISLNTISGLFATTAGLDLIDQALNLNRVGRAVFDNVNDPRRFGAGFGSIDLTIRVASVPEPEAFAQLGVGLVGLGLASFARRRGLRAKG